MSDMNAFVLIAEPSRSWLVVAREVVGGSMVAGHLRPEVMQAYVCAFLTAHPNETLEIKRLRVGYHGFPMTLPASGEFTASELAHRLVRENPEEWFASVLREELGETP